MIKINSYQRISNGNNKSRAIISVAIVGHSDGKNGAKRKKALPQGGAIVIPVQWCGPGTVKTDRKRAAHGHGCILHEPPGDGAGHPGGVDA